MMTEKMRTLSIKRSLQIAVIVALCFAFLPISPARAQSQTILAVQPEEAEVPLGNQIVLELTVTLGLNVNAFDLTVEYDPQVLSFDKWENGDYLKSLATVKEVDDPGTFRLAATQLAQPAVSGDGVLIEMTFNTEGAGESAINLIDVAFADSQGGKDEPVTEDGRVAVTLSSTYTPTPTPTRTPTTKPTLTTTPGPDGGTAYPIKVDFTPTLTTMPSGNSDDSVYVIPGEGDTVGTAYPEDTAYPSGMTAQDETSAAYPESISGDRNQDTGLSSGGEEQPASAVEQAKEFTEPSSPGLGVLLWVVLIIAILAIAAMVLIAIRRRKNKGEDILL